jgi:hypothetical protein
MTLCDENDRECILLRNKIAMQCNADYSSISADKEEKSVYQLLEGF